MDQRRTVSASRTAGLLLVAVAWALLLALTGSPEAILFTVPVFLLAAPLALGHYVGEEALAWLRSRPTRRSVEAPGLGLGSGTELFTGIPEAGFRPVRGPPVAAL